MNHGKHICNELKTLRRIIAEENHIPLEIEECTHEGDCRGTCPRCEAELRQIENALAERLRMGKVATVAGLTLALAGTAAAQEAKGTSISCPDLQPMPAATLHVDTVGKEMVTLRGIVRDSLTNEPLPFAHIVAQQGEKDIAGTQSDLDGQFKLRLPAGTYDIRTSAVGYYPHLHTGMQLIQDAVENYILVMRPQLLEGVIPVVLGKPAVFPDDPYSPTQQMEVEGVKVIVQ